MKFSFTLFFTLLIGNIFGQVDITFQVDMTGQTISSDGVHIAGSVNGWNTSSHTLTDQGGDIYAITMSLMPGNDYEYKFLNGNNWGTEETPPAACAINNNRVFTAPASDLTLALTPFGGCPTPNETQMVTFQVDMTGQTVSGNGVHVAGNFNGWSPNQTTMTLIGDDIYQVTVTVLSTLTTIQYKYLNGDAWGTEETIPAPCVNSNSNREYVIEGAGSTVDLPIYVFGTCTESDAPLPVELLFFRGNETQNGISLNWQTASEENNRGFQIDRSKDGVNWEMLDFIEGNRRSTTTQNYHFLDKAPIQSSNYYRLKQIDFDGQFAYSNIIIVDLKLSNSKVITYPNPVQDKLNITNAAGELILYNSIGQIMKKAVVTEETFQIDMSGLNNGIYLLELTKSNGSRTTNFIFK